MSPDQIVWARAVAEESYDGELIRDLCNALEAATKPAPEPWKSDKPLAGFGINGGLAA